MKCGNWDWCLIWFCSFWNASAIKLFDGYLAVRSSPKFLNGIFIYFIFKHDSLPNQKSHFIFASSIKMEFDCKINKPFDFNEKLFPNFNNDQLNFFPLSFEKSAFIWLADHHIESIDSGESSYWKKNQIGVEKCNPELQNQQSQ